MGQRTTAKIVQKSQPFAARTTAQIRTTHSFIAHHVRAVTRKDRPVPFKAPTCMRAFLIGPRSTNETVQPRSASPRSGKAAQMYCNTEAKLAAAQAPETFAHSTLSGRRSNVQHPQVSGSRGFRGRVRAAARGRSVAQPRRAFTQHAPRIRSAVPAGRLHLSGVSAHTLSFQCARGCSVRPADLRPRAARSTRGARQHQRINR